MKILDDKPEWKKFLKEFAAAYLLAVFNEFNRMHHRLDAKHAVLAALLNAVPIVTLAHLMRKQRMRGHWWKDTVLFGVVFALGYLYEWRKAGHSIQFTSVYPDLITFSLWTTAAVVLVVTMWHHAEGETEQIKITNGSSSPQ